MNIKPRRSALYMPCSNERAMQKAQQLDCDVILFDLEDAVAPEKKTAARQQIVKALSENDYGNREKIIRVNDFEGDWGESDIEALKGAEFEALLLPKVESVGQVNQALAMFGRDIAIWVMIETPKGVLNVEDIAAHDSVSVLVMGTNDLAKEMRVKQSETRVEFSYAFGHCVMAARANNCDILDGVYNLLDNAYGFIAVCEQGKALGFDGKTLIHPKQLDGANTVFSPSQNDIESAKAIVNAWNNSNDKGVLVVNGRLVEELHVVEAQRLLAVSAAINS